MVVYTLKKRRKILRHYFENFWLKHHRLRRSSFWSWRICKQAKLSHLGHAYIEKPTHPKRVTVWCGFWFGGIIGPYFFENEQGKAVAVNGDRYPYLLSTGWRYVPHSRSYTRCFVLRPVFEDHIVSHRSDVIWPPRSCDLISLDYYL